MKTPSALPFSRHAATRSTPSSRLPSILRGAVFLFGALVASGLARGQEAAPDKYLGLTPPGEVRKVFLAGTKERIAITRDGRGIFFLGKEGIEGVKYAGGRWSDPQKLFAGGTSPALSPDDQTLYFQDAKGRILQSRSSDRGWSEPTLVVEDLAGAHNFQVTLSGQRYATRMGRSGIQGQISRMRNVDGKCVLEGLPRPINTADNGVDFFMARDESYLIFVIHPGGQNGDLNISFRKKDGTWTEPQNLGPTVNGASSWEWGPFVTADNQYLFFTSATSPADAAVYWVRVDGLIQKLKPSESAP